MLDEFEECFDQMMENYSLFKRLVKQHDTLLYNRWKAGGFIIDEDIMSMYPNASKVFDSINSWLHE